MSDLEDTLDFLKSFGHQTYTIQLLKHGKPVECKCVLTDDLQSQLPSLAAKNEKGAEIFFMVNEGSTEIIPPNKTPRSQKNVHTLKSLYIDIDSANWADVKHHIEFLNIKPHWIIETSPKKYHVYFQIEDAPKTQKSVIAFQQLQRILAEVKGCDTSMQDYSKILRIPGFSHLKNPKKPHKIRIVFKSEHPKYKLADLVKLLSKNALEQEEKSHYQLSTEPIEEGSRHHEMTAFLGHVLSQGLAPEVATLAFHEYARQKFTSPKDWLPNGKRYNEVQNFITWKLNDLNNSRKAEQVQIATDLADKYSQETPCLDLLDQFYFNAPGLAGAITQEISQRARYPIPAFNFATAAAVLGVLKARYNSSEDHAASNYFLCLAPTGSGKNYAQDTLAATFTALKLPSLIQAGIRSEKGIALFLQQQNNRGLLSLDEAEHFFESLNERNTPHYLKACKDILLQLYTSVNNPYKTMGQTGNNRDTPITLRYPRLNLIAFGVLHTLEKAFTRKSIADGLLQRFIVITNFRKRIRNPDFQRVAALNGHIEKELLKLATRENLASEGERLSVQDLETELNQNFSHELQAEINRLKAKLAQRRIIKFTPQALTLYNDYCDSLDKKIDAEVQSKSGLEGVYTRAAEQAGRLATALSTDEIPLETIEYCIKFIDSRVNALYTLVSADSFDSTKNPTAQAHLNALVQFVAGRIKATNNPVSYRDIAMGFKIRDMRQLKDLLGHALEIGLLVENEFKNARGPKSKRYSLGEVL